MKKLLLFVLGGLLLLAIPVSVYIAQQQQDTRQQAATSGPGTDTCGVLQVTPEEVTACPDLSSSVTFVDVTEYKTNYKVKNLDSVAHTIQYDQQSYFCTNGNETVCTDNQQFSQETATINPGETITVTVNRANQGTPACGTFQTDFTINEISGKPGCTYNDFSRADRAGWGICQTGKNCEAIPTPTSSPTTSPTITVTPIPTSPACPVPSPVKNVKINCPNCSL